MTLTLPLPDAPHPFSGAIFSEDRTYRYALTRRWGHGAPLVVIGLNPSTADELADDPTIRRCIGFARREGCCGLVMLNAFALRATDPRVMLAHPEPVGPSNDEIIRRHTVGVELVVFAWGAHGGHRGRDRELQRLVPNGLCFGATKDGHPKHPLYLKSDTPLVRWTGR